MTDTPSLTPRARLVQSLIIAVSAVVAFAALFAFFRPAAFVEAAQAADSALNLEMYGEPSNPADFRYQGTLHAALISLLVLAQCGFAVLLARRAAHRADALQLALFMAMLGLAEGHFEYPAALVGIPVRIVNHVILIAAVLAMAAFLRFAAGFPVRLTRALVLAPGKRGAPGRVRSAIRVGLLDARIVWGVTAAYSLWLLVAPRLGMGTAVLVVLLLPWTILHGVRMIRAGYAVAEPHLRRRALWVVQGFAAGLVLIVFTMFGVPALAGALDGEAAEFVRSFPFYSFTTPIFVVCLAMAAFYDGGIDPALTIRRTAVYGALGMLAAFLFPVIEGAAQSAVIERLGLPDVASTWLGGATLTFLFGAVKSRAEELGTRVLGPLLPERTLAELPATEAVVVVVDPVDEHGDPDPVKRLATLHALARKVVPKHGGTIAFVVGDAVVLTFETPASAIAAVEGLRAGWPGGTAGLRVGVNAGKVIRVPEGGIVGLPLAEADRLRRAASPGEVKLGGDGAVLPPPPAAARATA